MDVTADHMDIIKSQAEYDALQQVANTIRAERDALRAALVSLLDGKSEFDIEYDTGMDADEARRIIDLAYNRQ